ncbi:MAG: ABC transporter permease, partial [Candidatus Acidiferrales bacterium]
MAVAILAIVSGAAVISALLNLDLGVQNKLTQEFRSLGANIVISPATGAATQDGTAAPALMREDQVVGPLQRLERFQPLLRAEVAAAAPYLYIVARAQNTPVVVAGTWLDQAQKIEPTWKLQGNWISSREDDSQCLVGRSVARQFHLAPGDPLKLDYMGRTAQCTVAGIVDAGGTEDDQVFASLRAVQSLANLPDQIGLVQISVSGAPKIIADYA